MIPDHITASKILIVDDSEYIRTIMTTHFRREGFTNLFLASDGAVAIEKFTEIKPDLVVLDMMLPKKHGMEVLQEIIQIQPDAKVVVVSSLATTEDVEKAKNTGASYYFVKPYDTIRFMQVIKELLTDKKEEKS